MSARAAIVTVAVAAVLGVAGLLIGAGGDERSTAFSLNVPPAGPVATLHQGQVACQGPFGTPAGFGTITVWISPFRAPEAIPGAVLPGAGIELTVRDADTGAALATGSVAGGSKTLTAPQVRLSQVITTGRRVRVCLRSRGSNTVQVLGAQLLSPVTAADAGSVNGSGRAAIALLFLRPHPHSLLSLIPTVFRRAALFRPGWVGAWTYWVLSAAFLGAFALGGVALARAVRSDAASDTHHHDSIT